MPKILTVYCCGTWYDGNQPQELICALSRSTFGKPGVDWILFPGPGSTQNLARYTTVHEDSSSPFTLALRRVRPLSFLAEGPFDLQVMAGTKLLSDLMSGLALGKGMNKNVAIFMEQVARIKPDQVNMIGWSRGACTCHMMANALYKKYGKSIPVNIFSIDPVPGPFNFIANILTIPPNVKEFIVVLMKDEYSTGFGAANVTIQDKSSTSASYLMFPGKHSAPVEKSSKPFEVCVHEIVRHLAQRRLWSWGTVLLPFGLLSNHEICERFCRIALLTEGPVSGRVRYMGNMNEWTPLRQPGLQVLPPWVNLYHLAVFSQVHPEIFALILKLQPLSFWLTGPRKVTLPRLPLLVLLVGRLAERAPFTYAFLDRHFFALAPPRRLPVSVQLPLRAKL